MKLQLIVALATGLGFAPAALAQDVVTGDITNGAGKVIGKATFQALHVGVLINVAIEPGGLTPGKHGMHLHAVGDCSDGGDGFKKSAAHVNHDAKKHGLANPEGPDMGDLPNIFAHADGSAQAEVMTTLIRLRGPNGLLDGDGGALIIHANADDHITQPIGNAGARVGCVSVK
jgi:Cu-Zn family superoxide dismutase